MSHQDCKAPPPRLLASLMVNLMAWPRRGSKFLVENWFYTLQLISLGIFFSIGTLWSFFHLLWCILFRIPRYPTFGQYTIHRLFQFFTWWLRATRLCRVEFSNLHNAVSYQGCIFVANHPSILDAVLILSKIPRAICVMRSGLIWNPAIFGPAMASGYILNDAGPGLIREARDQLLSGENLLIFPEGTRTRRHSRGVNSFKCGFALLATLTGAPIQTILIERGGHYLSKEMHLLTPASFPIDITLQLGEKFYPQPDEGPRELARRIEKYFEHQLDNTPNGIQLRKDVSSEAPASKKVLI